MFCVRVRLMRMRRKLALVRKTVSIYSFPSHSFSSLCGITMHPKDVTKLARCSPFWLSSTSADGKIVPICQCAITRRQPPQGFRINIASSLNSWLLTRWQACDGTRTDRARHPAMKREKARHNEISSSILAIVASQDLMIMSGMATRLSAKSRQSK